MQQLALLVVCALVSGRALSQATPGSAEIKSPASAVQRWNYTLTVDGYIAPYDTSFVNPIFTADHNWLHMEARYNDEDLRTGSLWIGYNFGRGDVANGDRWEFAVTPMIGGVFGRTTGIAPGCEALINYRGKIEASINNEYVVDTTSKSSDFYYSWPQLTYSPVAWFHVGAVAQHTRAYQTPVSIQRGFLVGFSHKKFEFTTYVFDPQIADKTIVLESGVNF
ncbi:MAG: hypothetical protein V4587_08295 [Acidobacteriota bacterium]